MKKKLLKSIWNASIKRNQPAVIEMLSTLLLLSFVVVIFAAIAYFVLSAPQPISSPIVTISGSMVDNNILFEHKGGEPIDLNSTIELSFLDTRVEILAYDYVDEAAKQDGLWGFGEQLVFPLYKYPDYVNITEVDMTIINKEPASSIMYAAIPIEPVCDLSVEVTVDNNHPKAGETVNITITIRNNGNINVSGMKIFFKLPEEGLIFVSYSTTDGTYDNSTGIWITNEVVQPGQTTELHVIALVEQVDPPDFIQLLIIQDGSGSIRKRDWDFAINGYLSAIGDPEIVPHNGKVEYTFVQFGGSTGTTVAKLEIEPTVITNDSIASILTKTENIIQMTGSTSTSCGILLGADSVTASSNFSSENMHIVLLITDGKASALCNIDGDYHADPPASVDYGDAAVLARDYLINHFGMDPMEDEFDIIAVHCTDEKAYPWFVNDMVWPQPGYFAPPYILDLPKQGFVSNVSSWAAFPAALGDIITTILHRVQIKSNIIQASISDPNYSNNLDGTYIVAS